MGPFCLLGLALPLGRPSWLYSQVIWEWMRWTKLSLKQDLEKRSWLRFGQLFGLDLFRCFIGWHLIWLCWGCNKSNPDQYHLMEKADQCLPPVPRGSARCMLQPWQARGVLFTLSRPKGLRVGPIVEKCAEFRNPFLKKISTELFSEIEIKQGYPLFKISHTNLTPKLYCYQFLS